MKDTPEMFKNYPEFISQAGTYKFHSLNKYNFLQSRQFPRCKDEFEVQGRQSSAISHKGKFAACQHDFKDNPEID